jgi:hypothetical protein
MHTALVRFRGVAGQDAYQQSMRVHVINEHTSGFEQVPTTHKPVRALRTSVCTACVRPELQHQAHRRCVPNKQTNKHRTIVRHLVALRPSPYTLRATAQSQHSDNVPALPPRVLPRRGARVCVVRVQRAAEQARAEDCDRRAVLQICANSLNERFDRHREQLRRLVADACRRDNGVQLRRRDGGREAEHRQDAPAVGAARAGGRERGQQRLGVAEGVKRLGSGRACKVGGGWRRVLRTKLVSAVSSVRVGLANLVRMNAQNKGHWTKAPK